MALRGNIGDLGVADIFQLIGAQNKTGSLTASHRDEKVVLYFAGGALVRSQTARRQRQDLLGAMLCRAEIITPKQLEAALVLQQQKRRRVGDTLIEQGALTQLELAAFTRLQSTETVFRLFLWRAGTYEFVPLSPAPEAGHPSVRAEALLMDGLRQADEWAQLRRVLSSYATTFAVRTPLDELLAGAPTPAEASEADLDAAFAGAAGGNPFELEAEPQDLRLQHIQANERLIYSLVRPGRDVQKIIDLSRLGEFETCRSLVNLVEAEILEVAAASVDAKRGAASVGGIQPDGPLRTFVAPLLMGLRVVAAVLVWACLCLSGLPPWGQAMVRGAAMVQPAALEEALAQARLRHLRQALGTYHAIHGSFPVALGDLVDAELVHPWDLSFAPQSTYSYAVDAGGSGTTLARPIEGH